MEENVEQTYHSLHVVEIKERPEEIKVTNEVNYISDQTDSYFLYNIIYFIFTHQKQLIFFHQQNHIDFYIYYIVFLCLLKVS